MPKYKKELSKEHLRPYEKAPVYKSCRFLNMNARHIRQRVRDNHLDLNAASSLQSYPGIIRHCNSFSLRRTLCEKASLPVFIGHDSEMTKLVKLYQ